MQGHPGDGGMAGPGTWTPALEAWLSPPACVTLGNEPAPRVCFLSEKGCGSPAPARFTDICVVLEAGWPAKGPHRFPSAFLAGGGYPTPDVRETGGVSVRWVTPLGSF